MKVSCILQHSEADCGAACVAMIAKHYGRTLTLNHTREAIGTGQLGTTLLGLRRGAELLGFNARSVKTSPEILHKIHEAPLPAVIHWRGHHWVTLYGRRGQKFVVADPAIGVRYLTAKELGEGWTDWVMLLLQPDAVRFFAQADDIKTGTWRFFKRVLPYWKILFEAFLCALVMGLLSLTSPFLIQILTDDVLVRGDTKLLTTLAIAVVVMKILSSGLSLVQANLIAHFAQRLGLGLVLEFGRTLLRLPLSFFEARRSGEIISRQQDIQALNQLISQVVVGLPSQVFIATISLSFMLFYSWKLTIAALTIGILMTFSTLIFLPKLQQKTQSALVLEAENQGVLVETFKGALVVKTTSSAPQLWEEFQTRFGRLANQTFGMIQIGIINGVFSRLVADMGSVFLLWFGSQLVIVQELSIGQLLAFNSMTLNFWGLIGTLVQFVDEFARVKTATERLGEVLDAQPEDLNDARKPIVQLPDRADILCTNLTFHYPNRVSLLQDFSVTIPGGKVVAVIGRSGCGKSTLAKLVAGLYPLQSGNIRIGQYNLQDLALDCLRQQVTIVPQEAHFGVDRF